MIIHLPSVIAPNLLNNFFFDLSNFDKSKKDAILDITTLKHIHSTSANYVLLIPFYLKSLEFNFKIKVDTSQETYKYLKMVGIIDVLENNFIVFDEPSVNKELEKNKSFLNGTINKLSSNTFNKTYIASNENDSNILKYLSNDYAKFIENSKDSDIKISTCIAELMYNVFDHSNQKNGAISVHFYSESSEPLIYIGVTDLGIGFKRSLIKSEKFKDFQNSKDSFFIESSVELSTTSTDNPYRGLGLYYVSKYSDSLKIVSGQGYFFIDNILNKKIVKDEDKSIFGTDIVSVIRLKE
jgi:anti-sigma regulatory factor (Ser/Thr protein kinase)